MRLGAPALLLNRVWDQPRTNTQQYTLATAIPNEGHRQATTQTYSKPSDARDARRQAYRIRYSRCPGRRSSRRPQAMYRQPKASMG